MTSLFIFRRDLRLDDNTALLEACASSDVVIPCFIFDPRQSAGSNDYFSSNAFQFMIESLVDLAARISAAGGRLQLLEGVAEDVVASLIARNLPALRGGPGTEDVRESEDLAKSYLTPLEAQPRTINHS